MMSCFNKPLSFRIDKLCVVHNRKHENKYISVWVCLHSACCIPKAGSCDQVTRGDERFFIVEYFWSISNRKISFKQCNQTTGVKLRTFFSLSINLEIPCFAHSPITNSHQFV